MMLRVVRPPATARRKPESRTLSESRIRTSGWMGADLSAPPMPPMWLWVQISPGMMIFPAASMRVAPAGTAVESAGPTASILPPRMTSVPDSIGSPEMGRILAPVKAVTGSSASNGAAGAEASRTRRAWPRPDRLEKLILDRRDTGLVRRKEIEPLHCTEEAGALHPRSPRSRRPSHRLLRPARQAAGAGGCRGEAPGARARGADRGRASRREPRVPREHAAGLRGRDPGALESRRARLPRDLGRRPR